MILSVVYWIGFGLNQFGVEISTSIVNENISDVEIFTLMVDVSPKPVRDTISMRVICLKIDFDRNVWETE